METLHSKKELLAIGAKLDVIYKLNNMLKVSGIDNSVVSDIEKLRDKLEKEVKIELDKYNKLIGTKGSVRSSVTGDIEFGKIESIDGFCMNDVYVIFRYDSQEFDWVELNRVKEI